MIGWKAVKVQEGEYVSPFADPLYRVTYSLNRKSENREQWLFYIHTDAYPASVVGLISPLVECAILAVEAEGGTTIFDSAHNAWEYEDFWAHWHNGTVLESRIKTVKNQVFTLATPSLTPLSVIWQGLRGSKTDTATLVTEVKRAMESYTKPPIQPIDKSIFFPIAGR